MRRLIVLLTVAVVLVAACSDDDSSTDAGKASSTTTTAATSTTTTAPEPTPSAGCGQATAAATKLRHTIEVAGEERFYLETVPSRTADDGPMPLVVDFHGLAEGAEIHTAMSGMGELGQQEGFAVVFPNGTGSPVRWATDPNPATNKDLQYVTKVLDEVESSLCIDTSRVYASGLSMGAFMSSLVACAMSDTFAAVAPVAGIQFSDSCTPDRPVPVIAFHGTKDPILLFNGGVNTDALAPVLGNTPTTGGTTTTTAPADLNGKGYPEAVRQWAERNGCKGSKDTDVSKEVVHRVYDCPADAAVEFYIVEGGGHTWPGSEFSKSIESIVGYTTSDINASELIWKFFQRFALPAQHG
jgi:polyhydroxybutyrate depolymerase